MAKIWGFILIALGAIASIYKAKNGQLKAENRAEKSRRAQAESAANALTAANKSIADIGNKNRQERLRVNKEINTNPGRRDHFDNNG